MTPETGEIDGTGETGGTGDVRATARRMYAAFNAHDHEAALDLFTADFRSHPLGTTGPDAVVQSWRRFHETFPEARVEVEDLLVDGDRAAVRTSVHGVPGQEPPTMLEIFRVRGGRIAELWGLSALRRD
ncbi:ester cyclase [Nonomuraea sp. NPDC050783]|uniref:ester cyclase n=1 Tax=Nonomuraea sp. NPDC050783 TaxID=3154634 RepID=UPI003465C57E